LSGQDVTKWSQVVTRENIFFILTKIQSFQLIELVKEGKNKAIKKYFIL
jgi:hypothetical protein